jgi:hypothetical protein
MSLATHVPNPLVLAGHIDTAPETPSMNAMTCPDDGATTADGVDSDWASSDDVKHVPKPEVLAKHIDSGEL